MAPKIFIDGEHGTTGLQIRTRMAGRRDVELLSIPEAERRNAAMREDMLNSADIAILCLPDDASKAAVADGFGEQQCAASSTRRPPSASIPAGLTALPKWTSSRPTRSQAARFVANPGCYPDGRHRPHPAAARRRHSAGRLSSHRQRGLRLYRRRQADDRADRRPQAATMQSPRRISSTACR